MKYSVFAKGEIDVNGNYVGGELIGTFKSERKAWETESEYAFRHPKEFVYTLREGDDVFTIIRVTDWFHVVDKETKGFCYGMCKTEEEAIKHKEWCEKYHFLGWY